MCRGLAQGRTERSEGAAAPMSAVEKGSFASLHFTSLTFLNTSHADSFSPAQTSPQPI